MIRTASVVLSLLIAPVLFAGEPFEEPPVSSAADIVTRTELIEGPHHRLEDEITCDGFFYSYNITSDFGDFDAVGSSMLEVRVQEIAAIAKLQEMSRTKAFADALGSAAMKPIETVSKVVSDPVGTVKGIPGGLNRKFRGLYYKGRKTAHKVGDSMSKDDEKKAKETSKESKESTTEQAAAATKSAIGFNSAYRELARRLEVDPYTDNPVLRKELNRLAQAAFTAGLSFKAVTPSVSVLDAAADVSDMVWELPPSELERRNNLALKELGITKQQRLDFFEHPAYRPSVETLLVRSLESLVGVEHPDAAVEVALLAETPIEALFVARNVRLLALYHQQEQALSELILGGNDDLGQLLAARAADGKVIVPAAVDYLTWQPELAAEGPLAAYESRELWLDGKASARAGRELEARGWRFVEESFARLKTQ